MWYGVMSRHPACQGQLTVIFGATVQKHFLFSTGNGERFETAQDLRALSLE